MSVSVGELPTWARPAGYPLPPKTRADFTREYQVRCGEAVTVYVDDRVVVHTVADAVGLGFAVDYRDL